MGMIGLKKVVVRNVGVGLEGKVENEEHEVVGRLRGSICEDRREGLGR